MVKLVMSRSTSEMPIESDWSLQPYQAGPNYWITTHDGLIFLFRYNYDGKIVYYNTHFLMPNIVLKY